LVAHTGIYLFFEQGHKRKKYDAWEEIGVIKTCQKSVIDLLLAKILALKLTLVK